MGGCLFRFNPNPIKHPIVFYRLAHFVLLVLLEILALIVKLFVLAGCTMKSRLSEMKIGDVWCESLSSNCIFVISVLRICSFSVTDCMFSCSS